MSDRDHENDTQQPRASRRSPNSRKRPGRCSRPAARVGAVGLTWRFHMLHAAVGALRRVTSQSRGAIGDISFGMDDGAVSASGLVFGVAAGTSDSSLVVLAGATGAIAGAVSMMAGRYLDGQRVGHRSEALLTTTRQHRS